MEGNPPAETYAVGQRSGAWGTTDCVGGQADIVVPYDASLPTPKVVLEPLQCVLAVGVRSAAAAFDAMVVDEQQGTTVAPEAVAERTLERGDVVLTVGDVGVVLECSGAKVRIRRSASPTKGCLLGAGRMGPDDARWHVVGTTVDAFARWIVEHSEVLGAITTDDAVEIGRAAADSALAAARWSQVVGDRLDTATVRELLGVSRQALLKRQAAGSLLGLPGRRTTWYPAWQFDVDSREVRPEVRDVISAFRDRLDEVDPLVIASWAVTPQEEDLDGLTPQEWIRLGRDRERLRLAAQRAASRLAR